MENENYFYSVSTEVYLVVYLLFIHFQWLVNGYDNKSTSSIFLTKILKQYIEDGRAA